jgi:Arc/MetJ-type ribon-helix-helix transcriptional regulator
MAMAKMVNFRCPPELLAKIEAAAKSDRRNLSDWIRLALEGLVEKRKTALDRKRARG